VAVGYLRFETKRSKFGNKRMQVDNLWFDSKKEANRYITLRTLLRVGEIHDLQAHPKFKLQAAFVDGEGNKHRAIYYEADFQYKRGDYTIVEDVKSDATKTQVYEIKKKMLLSQLPAGWVFREVL
jgi:uncharacterized protein DUF1064